MRDEKTSATYEKRCANCFVCFAETEFCPLEPGYDEDKVLRILQERIEKKKTGDKRDS